MFFCVFAVEEYLKILVEKMQTKGAYCFNSVRFKPTRVPFLGQSDFFGGKAHPDPGADQTAKNVGLVFRLQVNPGVVCFWCERKRTRQQTKERK